MNKFRSLLLIILVVFCALLVIKIFYLQAKLEEQDRHKGEVDKQMRTTRLPDSAQDKDKNLEQILREYLEDENTIADSLSPNNLPNRLIPDMSPVQSRYAVSQKFSDKHPGIDLAAPVGTPVISTAAGVVIVSRCDQYFGNLIIIDHLNGYSTYYAHLNELLKKKSDFAEKAEVIGTIGNTGFSYGPHLHYSIKKNDEFIDPQEFMFDK